MATTRNDAEESITTELQKQSDCYKKYGPYVQLNYYKEKLDSPGREFISEPLELNDGSGPSGSSIFVYMGNRGTVVYPSGVVSRSDTSELYWSIKTGPSIYEKYQVTDVGNLSYDYIEMEKDGRFYGYNSAKTREASKKFLACDAQQLSKKLEDRHGIPLSYDAKTTTYYVEVQTGTIIGHHTSGDGGNTLIPNQANSIDLSKLISIKRTDYEFKIVSMPRCKVLWSLKFAEFEALTECQCDYCLEKFNDVDEKKREWMSRLHRNVLKIRDSEEYEELLQTKLVKLYDYKNNHPSAAEESTVNQPDRQPGLYLGKIFVPDECKWNNDKDTRLVNGINLDIHISVERISVKRIAKGNLNASPGNMPLGSVGNHRNLVVSYVTVEDVDFVYIAIERCVCTLEDLMSQQTGEDDDPVNVLRNLIFKKNEKYPTPELFKLMSDVNDALAYLHKKNIIHGHLDPRNVLIYEDTDDSSEFEYTAKVFYMAGLTKATKVEDLFDEGLAMDMRDFGCLLLYCFSGGDQSFGNRLEQLTALGRNYLDVWTDLLSCHLTEDSTKDLKIAPDVADLICTLLHPDPAQHKRGHHHPRLWPPQTRLDYYIAVSDDLDRIWVEVEKEKNVKTPPSPSSSSNTIGVKVQKGKHVKTPPSPSSSSNPIGVEVQKGKHFKTPPSPSSKVMWVKVQKEKDVKTPSTPTPTPSSNFFFIKKIDDLGTGIFDDSWKDKKKVDPSIPDSLDRKETYIANSVCRLLRCIRNSESHTKDEFKDLLGEKPVEFEHYYSSRLPRLLIDVRKVVQAAAKEYPDIWKEMKNFQALLKKNSSSGL